MQLTKLKNNVNFFRAVSESQVQENKEAKQLSPNQNLHRVVEDGEGLGTTVDDSVNEPVQMEVVDFIEEGSSAEQTPVNSSVHMCSVSSSVSTISAVSVISNKNDAVYVYNNNTKSYITANCTFINMHGLHVNKHGMLYDVCCMYNIDILCVVEHHCELPADVPDFYGYSKWATVRNNQRGEGLQLGSENPLLPSTPCPHW